MPSNNSAEKQRARRNKRSPEEKLRDQERDKERYQVKKANTPIEQRIAYNKRKRLEMRARAIKKQELKAQAAADAGVINEIGQFPELDTQAVDEAIIADFDDIERIVEPVKEELWKCKACFQGNFAIAKKCVQCHQPQDVPEDDEADNDSEAKESVAVQEGGSQSFMEIDADDQHKAQEEAQEQEAGTMADERNSKQSAGVESQDVDTSGAEIESINHDETHQFDLPIEQVVEMSNEEGDGENISKAVAEDAYQDVQMELELHAAVEPDETVSGDDVPATPQFNLSETAPLSDVKTQSKLPMEHFVDQIKHNVNVTAKSMLEYCADHLGKMEIAEVTKLLQVLRAHMAPYDVKSASSEIKSSVVPSATTSEASPPNVPLTIPAGNFLPSAVASTSSAMLQLDVPSTSSTGVKRKAKDDETASEGDLKRRKWDQSLRNHKVTLFPCTYCPVYSRDQQAHEAHEVITSFTCWMSYFIMFYFLETSYAQLSMR